mmetsp:Transcript_37057/g.55190  ORF Transcript_37057/g.55190 Transcript_37057/m.55190 type:complete len:215 (-) Transcript_37057:210-854(-)
MVGRDGCGGRHDGVPTMPLQHPTFDATAREEIPVLCSNYTTISVHTNQRSLIKIAAGRFPRTDHGPYHSPRKQTIVVYECNDICFCSVRHIWTKPIVHRVFWFSNENYWNFSVHWNIGRFFFLVVPKEDDLVNHIIHVTIGWQNNVVVVKSVGRVAHQNECRLGVGLGQIFMAHPSIPRLPMSDKGYQQNKTSHHPKLKYFEQHSTRHDRPQNA